MLVPFPFSPSSLAVIPLKDISEDARAKDVEKELHKMVRSLYSSWHRAKGSSYKSGARLRACQKLLKLAQGSANQRSGIML